MLLHRGAGLVFLILLVFFTPAVAAGQIPFYTDDADTTAKGKFHLEFFDEHDILQPELYPARRQNTANYRLNFGVTDKLELDLDAPLLKIYNSRVSPLGNPIG